MSQKPKEESVSPAAEGSSKMRTQLGNKMDRLGGACVLRPRSGPWSSLLKTHKWERHVNDTHPE